MKLIFIIRSIAFWGPQNGKVIILKLVATSYDIWNMYTGFVSLQIAYVLDIRVHKFRYYSWCPEQ